MEGDGLGNGTGDLDDLSPGKRQDDDDACAGRAYLDRHRDLALHVASADPIGVSEADIPVEVLERERRIATEQVAQEGKPEQIRPKIVEGKLKKFIAERTLLGQPFVKDDKKTVGALVQEAAKRAGEPITVKRLARFKVGDG